MSTRISLVINTYNEEENIAACIDSARGLFDEVIVADMDSSDRTAEIAASMGASVHTVQRAAYVEPAREKAVSFASGDWIVRLDADERLTPDLCSRLRAIAEKDMADVVDVRDETWMFGRVIRYCGWQDTSTKVLFRKGFLDLSNKDVHAHPEYRGRLLRLERHEGEIIHYNYRDIRQFVAKMNNYTDGEALKLHREGGHPTPLRGVYWGMRHFFRRYFLRFGYKDGWAGFMVCILMGFYWFLAFCKAWELNSKKSKGSVGCSK